MLAGAPPSTKTKIVITAVSANWRGPFFFFFSTFRSYHQCKKSVQKEKRNLKKQKVYGTKWCMEKLFENPGD